MNQKLVGSKTTDDESGVDPRSLFTMSPYSGDPGLGSETDGGVLLLLALVLLLGMGMYHYKLVYGGQRNKYWESLSADDIRIVSFGSSKWVLALFRISALGYCSG